MRKITLPLSLLILNSLAFFASAHDRFVDVKITSQHLNDSVYMVQGSGGNIGVSAGEDGILIVDDQFAPLAERIAATLKGINPGDVKYVINTHYHGDHTGGNSWFKENLGSTVFAHENVRVRLASKEDTVKSALPVVTYEDGVKFHFNQETIHVIYLNEGHTDGDSVVWFEQANAVHTGDLFFKDWFPYIDLGAGGSVQGYVESVEKILSMIKDDTKVIPGHGSLATKAELRKFVEMIKETSSFVQAQKAKGMTVEQVVEQGLDEKWASWSWRFINEEKWIKTLY